MRNRTPLSDLKTHLLSANINPRKGWFARRKLGVAIAAQIMACSQVLAAPSGGVVVGGTGVIEQAGKETIITQGTDKLAIDWSSFDVAIDERVEFIQPTQSSIALNRILGTNGSQILGQIDANGHVVLVNPNGIFFGKDASVNAGGLIASGLQINPKDFINGDMVFKGLEGTDGAVINTGLLNASLGGNVTLLGKEVENRGLIMANMGRVNLVAGEQVVLTFDNQGLLGVQVDEAVLQNELNDEAAVTNSGEIKAENGQILLSASKAQDVFSQAVNHGEAGVAKSVVYHDDGSFTLGAGSNVVNTGTLDASESESLNASGKSGAGDVVVLGENITNSGSILANSQNGTAGNIELHANTTTELTESATLQADAIQSGRGGDVKLQGENIGLFDESSVSAVGANGGGTVLIGGDREGLNKQVKNAEFVYIGEHANVHVDAEQNGDGGELVAFAEDTARIYGQLSARGGVEKGDGGFVETSGKRGFQIDGAPDISASNGKGGHWLIDPYDIVILLDNINSTNSSPFTSTGENAEVQASSIQSALNSGGTVTVQTGAGDGSETELGDITLSRSIGLTENVESTLNLIAHNDININADITAGQVEGRKLNINLTANTSGNEGSVTFQDGVYISTSGGDFRIESAFDVDFGYASAANPGAVINLWGADYYSDTSNARYMAPSGSVYVKADHDVILAAPDSQAIPDNQFVNGQAFLIKGRETTETPKIEILAGNDITFNGLLYDNNANEVFNGSVVSESAFDGDGYTTLKLTAGNDIHFNDDLDLAFPTRRDLNELDRLHVVLQANSDEVGGGSVIFADPAGEDNDLNINTSGGDFTVVGSTNLDLTPLVKLDLSSAYGSGSFNVTASGDINVGEIDTAYPVSVTDATELRVMDFSANAGGTLTINNDIVTDSGSISLSANNLLLNDNALDTSRDGGVFSGPDGNAALGDIVLSTSSNLVLGKIDSTGGFSISGNDAVNDVFSVTQVDGETLEVDGTSVFDIGGSDITLRNDIELLGDIRITSANNVDFLIRSPNEDSDPAVDFNLGASSIAGDFTFSVNSNGNITNSGPLVVGGISTFYAANNNITLDDVNNNFSGAVFVDFASQGGNDFNADTVVITDIDDLILGNAGTAFKTNQDLTITAGGDITQIGVLEVGGNAILGAGSDSSITLDADNLFGLVDITQAQSASITNSQNLTLGSVAALDSLGLTVKNGGDLSQNSALTITDLVLDIGGQTTLDTSANQISTLTGTVNSGSITADSSLTLNDLTLRDNANDFSIVLASNNIFSVTADATISGDTSNTLNVDAEVIGFDNNFSLDDGLDLVLTGVESFTLDAAVTKTLDNTGDSRLSVEGSNNSDTFVFGTSAATDLDGLSIDGSGGPNDTLTAPDATNTWAITSGNSTLTLADTTSVITFTDMDRLVGGTAVDGFTIGAGVDGLTLSGGVNADTADLDVITSPTGANIWSLENGTLVNDGDTLNFSEIESFIGGGDTDQLIGVAFDTDWTISAGNAGVLTYNDGADQQVQFSNFTDFTGGGAKDTFTIESAGITAAIDGGAGANDELNAFASVNRVWAVAENSGTLSNEGEVDTIDFTNIEVLNGSDDDVDTVSFSTIPSVSVSINAGDGVGVTDVISYAAVDTNTEANVSLGVSGLNGFEQVQGNNGNLVLQGGVTADPADTAVWVVNSENTGTVTIDANTTDFTGFAHLLGGNGKDEFTLNADLVDLGGAHNSASLSGGDGDNTFNINTTIGALISGGADNDIFNVGGADIIAVIDGGAGVNDELNAFATVNRVWTVADNRGTLSNEGEANTITFSNIEVLNGSDDDVDTVSFSTIPSVSVSINAGNGVGVTDVISYAAVDTNTEANISLGVSGLNGFEQVQGNNGNLVLQGGVTADPVDTAIWLVSSENSGTVTIDGNITEFSDFAHLLGGSGKDEFTFNADLVDLGGPHNSASLSGGDGADTFVLNVDVSSGAQGGGGDDTFDINTSISSLISGDDGNDIFNIGAADINATLNGNTNSDTLNAFENVAHTWAIKTSDSLLSDTGGSNTITFNNIEVLTGSDANVDTVAFSTINPSVSVSIDAGTATGVNDVISYASVSIATNATVGLGVGGLTGFELIEGNNGNLVLQGSASATPSNATQWAITASNEGNVTVDGVTTEFSDFAHLSGADGRDNFTTSAGALVTSISGGDGSANDVNTVDVSGFGSDIKIELSSSNTLTDAAQINLSNFDSVTADAQSTNELVSAGDNVWNITDLNQGSVTTGTNTTNFTGFNFLIGKTGTDNFVLGTGGTLALVDGVGASVSAGAVDGGAGANSVTAANRVNSWSVTGNDSGNVTTADLALTFNNIQTLLGGNVSDTLNANDVVNIWTLDEDFGGDVNGLKFSGMEVLVGGTSSDDFNVSGAVQQGTIIGGDNIGGSGSDILNLAAYGERADITLEADAVASSTSDAINDFAVKEIENIVGDVDDKARVFGPAALDNIWTIAEDGSGVLNEAVNAISLDNIDSLVGGDLNDTFEIQNTTLDFSIQGGTGDNELLANAGVTNAIENAWFISGTGEGTLNTNIVFANVSELTGDADTDTFDFSAASSVSAMTVRGRSGLDELVGFNAVNNWVVNSDNDGVLASATTPASTVNFFDIEQLTGGNNNDSFTLNALVGAIVGGGGTSNSVDATALVSSLSVGLALDVGGTQLNLEGINSIAVDGSSAINELVSNTNTAWSITGPNSGEVIVNSGTGSEFTTAFDGFNQLTGTASNDFVLEPAGELIVGASTSGLVAGGAGANTLTAATGRDNTWTLTGANSGSVSTVGVALNFSNIQALEGDTATDTLTATNVENTWTLDEDFGGDLNGLNFVSMDVLVGGTDVDAFTVASNIEQGEIFGGTGDDTVVLNDGARVQTIQTEADNDSVTLSNATVTGLLDGGAGQDDITFSNYSSVLSVATEANASADIEAYNFEQLFASSGSGYQLFGLSAADNTWDITDEKAGSVNGLAFDGFDTLLGGSANDDFNFIGGTDVVASVAIKGDLDGVANTGVDTANYSQVTNNIAVVLNGPNTVDGIEVVVGNNDGSASAVYNSELQVSSTGTNTWTVDQVNSGSVSYIDGANTHAIIFKDFNQLTGGDGADTFTVNVNAASGLDTVADIRGQNAIVQGGVGDDVFNLYHSISAPINGDAGSDQFHFLAAALAAKIDGGANTDTLFGFEDTAHYWLINSGLSLLSDSVIAPDTTVDASSNGIVFSAIENMQGSNAQVDYFTFSTPTVTGTIDAGDAVTVIDEASFAAVDAATTVSVTLGDAVLSSFEKVVGHGENSYLTGSDVASTWSITATNAGQVVADEQATFFEDFANLLGGSGNDDFELSALVASIDGGDGVNNVDASLYAGDLSVALDSSVVADLNLQTIASVTANDSYQSELISAASNSEWTISDTNSGILVENPDSTPVSTTFSGFNILRGTQNNRFVLNELGQLLIGTDQRGSVIGGASDSNVNELQAYDRANEWLINGTNSGTVSTAGVDLSFTDVNELIGGTETDHFAFAGVNLSQELVASIDGGGGEGVNTLSAKDQSNSWVLSGTGDRLNTIDFTSVHVLQGGSEDDEFTVLSGAEKRAINGGLGSDIFDLTTFDSRASVLINGVDFSSSALDTEFLVVDAERFIGNSGQGSVLQSVGITDNFWQVNTDGSGSLNGLINYSDFYQLVGGEGADAFTLNGRLHSGIIDGGLGENTLLIAADNLDPNTWTLTGNEEGLLNNLLDFINVGSLVGGENADTFDFSGIEETAFALLDGAGGDDLIIGMNLDTNWVIEDVNRGYFNSIGGTASFANVENFRAGVKNDNFTLNGANAYATGLIDAGDPDVLNEDEGDRFFSGLYTGDKQILENTGGPVSADSINVRNFEDISAGNGFTGGPGSNTWEIVGPNQVRLNGGTTVTSESITGGSGDDIFIFTTSEASSELVDGGEGNNTIQIDFNNKEHHWGITGEDSGVLLGVVSDSEGAVVYSTTTLFENIQNLIGSENIDHFLFADTGSIGSVEGGQGADLLAFVSQVNTSGVSEPSSIDYNVTLSDNNLDENRYSTISRVVDGVVAPVTDHFSGINKLRSGAGDDHFFVSGIADELLIIDGGEGQDLFDTSGWSADTFILLESPKKSGASVAGNNFDLFGFDSFAADSNQSNNLQGMADAASDWLLTQDFSGRVSFSETELDASSLVTFNGFQTLIGSDEGNVFDLAGFEITSVTGGSGIDVLDSGGAAGADYFWLVSAVEQNYVEASQGVDSFTVSFDDIEQLVGGSATDRLTVSGASAQDYFIWAVNDNSVGNPGSVTLQGSVEPTVTFADFDRLNGGGSDWLQGSSQDNTWDFTGVGSGTLGYASTSVAFNNFHKVIGGDLKDTFNVPSMADMSSNQAWIDGGAGLDDILNISDSESNFSLALYDYEAGQTWIDLFVTNVESLNSTGLNNLFGAGTPGIEYSWVIEGQYRGSVSYTEGDIPTKIEFSQFDRILGGAANDRFEFTSSDDMNTIYGGAGEGKDFIDFSNVKSDQIVEVNNSDTNSGVSGIEGFIGNNDGSVEAVYQSTLRVSESSNGNTNVWTISDINDGTFVQNDGKTITFKDFNHLLGGRDDDAFYLENGGQISGTVAGGVPGTDAGNDQFSVTGSNPNRLAIILEQDLAAATDYSGASQGRNEIRETEALADLNEYTLLSNIDSIIGNGEQTTLVGGNTDTSWQFTGVDTGEIRYRDLSQNRITRFTNVSNIQGSHQADSFVFNAGDGLSGWLSGGAGQDFVQFDFEKSTSIEIAVADMDQSLLRVDALVNVRNDIERVLANSTSDSVRHNTIIGNAQMNQWLIDELNTGEVNGVDFSGFDSITGNAQDDLFSISVNGRLSGLVDGEGGNNTVNTTEMNQSITVVFGLDHRNIDAHLQIDNIQNLSASKDYVNTLVGANTENTWRIDGVNSGELNQGLLFSEFNNLVGGNLVDTYSFSSTGSLSGYIDGGASPEQGKDTVDYSQLSGPVQVALADFIAGVIQPNPLAVAGQSASIYDIEQVRGNNTGLAGGQASDAEIIAANYDNAWRIDDIDGELVLADGLNDGSINFNGTTLSFIDFNVLSGGNRRDTFDQINGVVTGSVNGGAGDDIFNINTRKSSSALYNGQGGNDVFNYRLTATSGNVETVINGGSGDDSVLISGDEDGFTANYRSTLPIADNSLDPLSASAVISYQRMIDEAVIAQAIEYSNVESVQQGASVQELTIEGSNSEQADQIELSNGFFTVNSHAPVAYANNTPKLTVNAGSLDIIHLNQSINVFDTLTLNNAQIVVEDADAVIDTTNLNLNAVSGLFVEAGEELTPLVLNTNITNLTVNDVINDVAIVQESNQASPLILQNIFNVGGSLSVYQLNGNIEQSDASGIDVRGALRVVAENGSINLQNSTNNITGQIELLAENGTVNFTNDSAIDLIQLNAEGVNLVANGDISSTGSVVVSGVSRLSAIGDISLTHQDNRMGTLKVDQAQNVDVVASGWEAFELAQSQASGTFDLAVNQLTVSGPVQANSISLRSDTTLDINELSGLTSQSAVSLYSGNDLNINANVSAVNGVSVTVADGNYYQNADVVTQNSNVQLNVFGDVTMQSGSQLSARSGNVSIEGVTESVGAGTILLSEVVASTSESDSGVVKIITRDRVVDNNGTGDDRAVNITANELVARSVLGFGAGDDIETQVSVVDVVNSQSVFDAIQITNSGELEVRALWANGNIDLTNDLDVKVMAGSINAFYDGRPLLSSVVDAIDFVEGQGRPREDAKLGPYTNGSSELTLDIEAGALRMLGQSDVNNPHLAAYSTDIDVDGDIGNATDPQLVLYVPQDFSLSADKRWKRFVWAFGLGFPDGLIEENVTPVPTIDAGEQLIAVEELEEVDPAVFLAVKNYYYNEISILLPRDQRYDDEDE